MIYAVIVNFILLALVAELLRLLWQHQKLTWDTLEVMQRSFDLLLAQVDTLGHPNAEDMESYPEEGWDDVCDWYYQEEEDDCVNAWDQVDNDYNTLNFVLGK